MRVSRVNRLIAAGLLLLAIGLAPAESLGETTRANPVQVGDVKLDEAGVLRGVVINVQGIPVAGVPIAIRKADGTIARTATDPFGCFALEGLSEGIHRLTSGHLARRIRAWAGATAPAGTGQLALLVVGGDLAHAHVARSESRPNRSVLRTAVRPR